MNTAAKDSEKQTNREYFSLDPSYINTEIVKNIGIDPAINSILAEVNHDLIVQTIRLDDFAEKTISPLKKQLCSLLNCDKMQKMAIINSVITCINRNIEAVKDSQRHSNGNTDNNGKNGRAFLVSDAKIIVELASQKQNTELFFKNQFGQPYVAVRSGSDRHLEIISLKSSKYKHYLARLFRENQGGQIVGKDSISNAIDALAVDAEFDGETIPLHLRVAWGHPANRAKPDCIYYDMTDQERRMIEISSYGARIINGSDENTPILFKRHNQIAQGEPERNYELDIFDRFLNLTNVKEKHRQLVKVYIVSLLIPEIAHVILNIHGPKGAAKSFLLRLIKTLIDPSKPVLLSLPRDTAQFIQQVSHNYLAFYDNVKYISQELSDEICKAVTGIDSTKRELYTDDEDVIYEYKHCLSLNGINIALTESDALDRGLMVELEEIKDENRRKEEDLLAEFERIRPKVFACILDIVVKAMQIRPTLRLPMLTRMADFTEWGEAISRAMGYEKMSFIRELQKNRSEQNLVAVEESIVGSLLVKFWLHYKKRDSKFEGSSTDLYGAVVEFAADNDVNINNRQFPKTPAVLVKKLNVIKPNLKEAYGIIVQTGRDSNNNSIITIYDDAIRTANPSSAAINNNQTYALQILQKQTSSTAIRR